METQDIKNMGLAYFQVLEAMKKKKMDPVDADELKGSHADRDDKDIDNDGDADKSMNIYTISTVKECQLKMTRFLVIQLVHILVNICS
jgi:hypothetical protein